MDVLIRRSAPALVAVCCASLVSCEAPPASFGSRAASVALQAGAAVDPQLIRTTVSDVVAARQTEMPVTPAWYQHPHTNVSSATYVADQFRTLGYSPVVETHDENGIETRNVYVDIPGTRNPGELVLLTGHHDAWYGGADDNATALAVMIEAARVLKESHPDRTIRIVAFDFEEYGLVGSQRYLARHANEHVAMVLNMDCVGYAKHEPGTQLAPPGLQAPSTGDFLAAVGNEPANEAAQRLLGLANEMPNAPTVVVLTGPGNFHTAATADFLRSDHAPFWRAGIPGLFITDTANFRNPNYHQPTDTPDTLDYDFLARVTRLVVGATVAYATID